MSLQAKQSGYIVTCECDYCDKLYYDLNDSIKSN